LSDTTVKKEKLSDTTVKKEKNPLSFARSGIFCTNCSKNSKPDAANPETAKSSPAKTDTTKPKITNPEPQKPKRIPISENREIYRKLHNKILTDTDTEEMYKYQMLKLKSTDEVFLEDLTKDGDLPKSKSAIRIEEPLSKILTNHLEFNWHLGHKRALFWNLKNYYDSQNQNVFDVCPITYTIKELEDSEFSKFVDCYRRIGGYANHSSVSTAQPNIEDSLDYKSLYPKNIWILKPGENTNKGAGIYICETISEIRQTIKEEKYKNSQRTFILQKYIEKPLLYKKRKFDIRAYMLISSINQ
jgi:hypothetical protein